MAIGVIIPAARVSRRMGQPKPLLPLGETDFIGTIVHTLRSCGVRLAPVVVVRRADDHALAQRLAALRAAETGETLKEATVPDGSADMLASIRAALPMLAGAVGTLVWPVDAPAIRGTTVACVARAALERPEVPVLPAVDGSSGHPAYVPCALLVRPLPPGAAPGLRGVLETAELPPVWVSVSDPYALMNVNTPSQYRALLDRLHTTRSAL